SKTVFFSFCFSFLYLCNVCIPPLSRRILGFSPIIIGRHVRNICMLYLEDISRN
uniref:Uncharacterized protein n=1 Tax=Pavo cristatus TaxID=9049 RepID=A0A8C9F166_PAVCR